MVNNAFFGFKNVGASYQKAMNLIFHDLNVDFVQVYIDYIVIKLKSKISNSDNLRKSFERMRKHGLKMNLLKCAFGLSVGESLGFIVYERLRD